MKKLFIEMFDVSKIGKETDLRMICGGGTFHQTGSGTNASGASYKDWAGDNGSHKCGMPDDKNPDSMRRDSDNW